MNWIFCAIVLFAAVVAVSESRKRYVGDILVRVRPTTRVQLRLLRKLRREGTYELDFWSSPSFLWKKVKIRVPNKSVTTFVHFLIKNGYKYKILDYDLEKIVAQDELNNRLRSTPHTYYMRHSQINAYIKDIANRCGSSCSIETIGKSYQGRDMNVLKISKNANNPIIWLDGGIHAREWIAPATLIYIADELVKSMDSILDKFSVHFLPVANPDGYEYSHTNDRMWRKTRSPGGICIGVDGNRNFGYKFGGKGTSSSSCSDIYRGNKAFSEQETENISNYITTNKNKVKAYFAVHSYGQYVLHPYGYDYGINPGNVQELKSAGNVLASAIRKINTSRRYTVGHSADLLYPAAGGADDWAHSIGIQYAYTIELPDTGRYGFILPPSQIINVGKETYAGLVAFMQHIA